MYLNESPIYAKEKSEPSQIPSSEEIISYPTRLG